MLRTTPAVFVGYIAMFIVIAAGLSVAYLTLAPVSYSHLTLPPISHL